MKKTSPTLLIVIWGIKFLSDFNNFWHKYFGHNWLLNDSFKFPPQKTDIAWGVENWLIVWWPVVSGISVPKIVEIR